MGFMAECQIRDRAKKGQSVANDRLSAILAEQQRTNELLAQIVTALESARLSI